MLSLSHSRRLSCSLLLLALAVLPLSAAEPDSTTKPLTLGLRSRVETARGSGRYHVLTRTVRWEPTRTAAIVCDMWDKHWCDSATKRVAEMAPRMDELLRALRKQGVLIIHCPSDTMDFYKDTPQRRRAQAAPKVKPRVPLERWCRLNQEREGSLPIDDSDGGCDCPGKSYRAWSRQIAALHIEEPDAITDSDEAYYLLQQRGIDNVLIMGVHTNMCVLGRPFGIRQLVAQGKNVVLVRDMTDTMYNPARSPHVSHFTGTDLVVAHIEKNWCPSTTSADVLGGKPFRFKDDHRPHLVCVLAEDEYQTEKTVPELSRRHLDRDFRVSFVFDNARDHHDLPGLEVLDEADVALFSIRRRVLPPAQMKIVRRFLEAGKPLVAIRTSSHAFSLNKQEPPAGHESWPTFDRDILGCHYNFHHDAKLGTRVRRAPDAERSPLLEGVPEEWKAPSSLYRVLPLAEGAKVLLVGEAGKEKPEPVAWTWKRKDGGRVFSTTLGHPGDFQSEPFQHLLANGIRWAAGLSTTAESQPSSPSRGARFQRARLQAR